MKRIGMFSFARRRNESPRGFGVRRQGGGEVAALDRSAPDVCASEAKAVTPQTPSPQSKTLAR